MKTVVAALALGMSLLGGCATTLRLAPIDSNSPVAILVSAGSQNRGANAIHDTSVCHDANSGARAGFGG